MNKDAAQHWIDSAGADLRSIEHMIDDEFLTHIVAFHAQQCVEKCFKALLEYHSKGIGLFLGGYSRLFAITGEDKYL